MKLLFSYAKFENHLRARVLQAAAKGGSMNAEHIFGRADASDSGVLTVPQFAKGLRTLGLDVSDQEIKKIATRYDNGRGRVLWREFCPFVESVVSRYDKVKTLLSRIRKQVEKYEPPTRDDTRARNAGAIAGASDRDKDKVKQSPQARVFEQLDINNDGHVDIEEFSKGLRVLGVRLDPDELRRLTDALDWDNDGEVGVSVS